VAKHSRASDDNTGAGESPPPARPLPRERRLLDRPANDNGPGAGQRILRAAVFVLIGSVIAWLLHQVF